MIDTPDIEVRNGRLWLQWPDVYPYDIELHRIRDKYDLAQWAVHLADKNWMCPCRLIQFLTAAAQAKGWVSGSMPPDSIRPAHSAPATMPRACAKFSDKPHRNDHR